MIRRDDPESFDPAGLRTSGPLEYRLYLAGKMIREIGVPTIMLGIFVGWFSGWIPSPLTAMAADLRTHVNDMTATTRVLTILAGEIREQNRILRFKECAAIRDPLERRLCFGQDQIP